MPLTSRIRTETLAQNTEKKVLGPNTRRVLIMITTDNAGPVYIRNDSLGNTAGGVNIVNTSGQYEFPKWKYGDMIYNEFFMYHNVAATVQVGIIEVEN